MIVNNVMPISVLSVRNNILYIRVCASKGVLKPVAQKCVY